VFDMHQALPLEGFREAYNPHQAVVEDVVRKFESE
jgi:hypothetical protein